MEKVIDGGIFWRIVMVGRIDHNPLVMNAEKDRAT